VSIAAGILLQAVASTGSVEAETFAYTGTEVGASASTEAFEPEAGTDAPAEETEALPTVAVGADEAVPETEAVAAPEGEEESEEETSGYRRLRLTARGGGAQPAGEWTFGFHGFFRAPMRVGLGTRDPLSGQSKTTWHSPIVPDDSYYSPSYTLHNPRDWAELYFSYGNKIVTGTIGIHGFQFTDAAWNEATLQFGIAQAYVTLTPTFRKKWFNLMWKLGSFDNRYGESGRYDAGEFETYVFGRTHGTGEAGRVEFTLGSKGKHKIGLEQGIAVKRPNPNQFNAHRFSFLHHYHLDYNFDNKVEIGLHYLNSFAKEADRLGTIEPFQGARDGSISVVGPDVRFNWGKLGYLYLGLSYITLKNAGVVAPTIEVIHSLGGGQTVVNDALTVNPYLGTSSGPFANGLVDNYLESVARRDLAINEAERVPGSGGNGTIVTFAGQFEHSVKRIMLGNKFDGESWDVALKLAMMFNKVESDAIDDRSILEDTTTGTRLEYNKFKITADLLATPLKWLGVGARFTHVSPNSTRPEQDFSIISPRLVFKTNWISRERIEISYSRYMYDTRVCRGGNNPSTAIGPVAENPILNPELLDPPGNALTAFACAQPPSLPSSPEGFGASSIGGAVQSRGQPLAPPDENVFMISATFWW